jgi:hypothetical protein
MGWRRDAQEFHISAFSFLRLGVFLHAGVIFAQSGNSGDQWSGEILPAPSSRVQPSPFTIR